MIHIFEQLTFRDFGWRTLMFSELMAAEVQLIVEGSADKPPQDWQRRTLDKFISLQRRLEIPVYRAIHAYYLDTIKERQVGEPIDIEQLKQQLTPTGIIINDLSEDDEEIGLLFECSWDPEHGLGVRLARWQIDEVGGQDICW